MTLIKVAVPKALDNPRVSSDVSLVGRLSTSSRDRFTIDGMAGRVSRHWTCNCRMHHGRWCSQLHIGSVGW